MGLRAVLQFPMRSQFLVNWIENLNAIFNEVVFHCEVVYMFPVKLPNWPKSCAAAEHAQVAYGNNK